MTTLVTGGTGFLGRHLVQKLLDRGEDVRVLTRSFDLELADMGAEVVEGSLSEAEDVRRAVDGIERIYHLAGKVERDRSRAHLMYDLHVEGTRRLLGSLVDRNIEKIVYASTSGTVGVGEGPDFLASEDSPTAETIVKNWPYYLSKIYAERVCEKFIGKHDMPIVMMRPTLLLGPGDRKQSSTGDVVLFLKRKIPAQMSGGMSFVDVRDTADAFIAAMDKAPAGESYLLGSQNLPIVDFLKRLEEITGIPRPKMPVPGKAAVMGARLLDRTMRAFGKKAEVDPVSVEMAQYYWYIDSSKAQEELDWQPRSPNETLRDTVRWIQKNHPEFAPKRKRRKPPEEFVPKETVEFAEKMANGE
ncbi:NAD-dependent epimerase/dehydratase family protein [Persicimonas caeni]|nr:NAD-dependent epimerase/dehydratase family protein [Persicimonas caeni]